MWRPRPGCQTLDEVLRWVRPYAHQAQVAVGLLLCLLPSLVKGPLWFPQACLTPIWFLIGKLVIIRDLSIGSHLRFAARESGSLALGIVWAGGVVSFAKAVTARGSDAELALQCVVGGLGALPVSAGRPSPIENVWVNSLTASVIYGTTVLVGHTMPSVTAVWTQVVQWLMLSIALATAATVVVGCLVLPTTAAQSVAQEVSKVLSGTAQALDRCMSLLCMSPEHRRHLQTATDSQQQAQGAQNQQGHLHSQNQDVHPGPACPVAGWIPARAATAGSVRPARPSAQDSHSDRNTHQQAYGRSFPDSSEEDPSQGGNGRMSSGPPRVWAPAPVLIHDLDGEDGFKERVLSATEPSGGPGDLAVFRLLPTVAGEHLLPAGEALKLRRALGQILRLVTAANAEPTCFHSLAAGWSQLLHGRQGVSRHIRCTRTEAHPGLREDCGDLRGHIHPWWSMRFDSAAWNKVLVTLAGLLDSLSALEAVSRDLQNSQRLSHQPAAPYADTAHEEHVLADSGVHLAKRRHLPAHQSASSTTIELAPFDPSEHRIVRGAQHSDHRGQQSSVSSKHTRHHQRLRWHGLRPRSAREREAADELSAVWDLWLLSEGAKVEWGPAAGAPTGPARPHPLHDAVRTALRDAAVQTQRLSAVAGAWPQPGGPPSVDASSRGASSDSGDSSSQSDTGGGDSEAEASSSASSTVAARIAAGQDGAGGSVGERPAAAGQEHGGRVSVERLEHAASATLTAAASLLRQSVQLVAGTVAEDPFALKLDRRDLHDLECEPQHSLQWHKRALPEAMLQRARGYWAATLRSMTQAEELHQPVRLLRGEQVRAQYFIALATHQVLSQLEQLSTDLRAAYHREPAASVPVSAASLPSWIHQLLPLVLCLDTFKHLGHCAVATLDTIKGGPTRIKQAFSCQLVTAALKYWAVNSVMLVVILVLVTKLRPGAFPSLPIFAYITATAVMRPQVESTSSQAVLRIVCTALGCVLAWGLLETAATATRPAVVGTIMIVSITLLSCLTHTQLKLVAFITATGISSTIACQLAAAGCCRPGFTGSTGYAVERFVSVAIGVLVPVLVNHLVFPWYLSLWALGRLADGYSMATSLLAHQYQSMVHAHEPRGGAAGNTPDTAVATQALTASVQSTQTTKTLLNDGTHFTAPTAGSVAIVTSTGASAFSAAAGVAENRLAESAGAESAQQVAITVVPTAPAAINTAPAVPTLAAVQAPLTEVIATLARDAALWQRGVLATPHAVHALMASMTLMADRLAAMQVVLQGAAVLSPTFSSWSSEHLTRPLDPEVQKVLGGICGLTELVCRLLKAWKSSTVRARLAQELGSKVNEIVAMRVHAHAWHMRLRQALHQEVRCMAVGKPHSEVHGGVGPCAPSGAAKATQVRFREDDTGPVGVAGASPPEITAGMQAAASVHAVGGASGGNYASQGRSGGGGVDGEAPPDSIQLVESGRGLSGLLLSESEFHPSDTVSWLACAYALIHAVDAAIYVSRVAVAAAG